MRMISIGKLYNLAHDILLILYLAHDLQVQYNIAILGGAGAILRAPPPPMDTMDRMDTIRAAAGILSI